MLETLTSSDTASVTTTSTLMVARAAGEDNVQLAPVQMHTFQVDSTSAKEASGRIKDEVAARTEGAAASDTSNAILAYIDLMAVAAAAVDVVDAGAAIAAAVAQSIQVIDLGGSAVDDPADVQGGAARSSRASRSRVKRLAPLAA